jgi:hypothetical protein
VSACVPTYQWQQSTSLGGPWTNIAGQTNPTAAVTTTQTMYYQCFMSCAGNTAVSSVQQLSVSSFTPPPCSLSTYTAAPTTYSFDTFVGTVLPTTDDVLYSTVSSFGFPFCYTGQQLSQGYVSSNSSFVFDGVACFPNILPMPGGSYASPGAWTGWSISQPAPTTTDYTPRNAVLGPWQDIYPTIGGTLRFGTLGTAPNRRFVASFENVPMFSCTTLSFTGQIKLFETSNNIEIHIQNKPLCSTWNSGQAILGLQNYDGTIYSPPVNQTMHNSPTQYTMTNWAYRWTSSCPSQSICGTVLPVSFKALYGQNFDNVNKLWWETLSEENMKEFQVERSMDAVNFDVIQTVPAAGKPNTYVYNDDSFRRGYINYYRVTGYGRNGEKYTTSVYPIYSTDEKVTITAIYPNPTAEQLSVSILGRTTSNYSFIIYDQLGNIVLQKDQALQFGMMQVDLNIASLASGVYVLEIKSPENASISRKKFSKF